MCLSLIGSLYGQENEAADNSVVVERGCEKPQGVCEGADVGAAGCEEAQAYAGGSEPEGVCVGSPVQIRAIGSIARTRDAWTYSRRL